MTTNNSISPVDAGTTQAITGLRREAFECLTGNILPFWLDTMRDKRRGGWYGQMTGRGQLMDDAPRSAILYARLLWTFSAAYRVLHSTDPIGSSRLCSQCLDAAKHACDYIIRHFIDTTYGGTYWSVDAYGQPLDTKKQTYAQGFMIYGFAEHARALAIAHGDCAQDEVASSLRTAMSLFSAVESHALDSDNGGYIEAMTRDWQPLDDMRLSAHDENYPKGQNTHLHIMESYTNLLRAMRETGIGDDCATQHVRGRIKDVIGIFIHHILNPATAHLDLFFGMDWSRKSQGVSYGHDIECSWLLDEAAHMLGDEDVIMSVQPVVRRVAAASVEGMMSDGSMAYEGNPGSGPTDSDRHWWVQAEAVVGFLNLWQNHGDAAALDSVFRLWSYIKARIIDHTRGEWLWSIRADGTPNLDDDHAGFWKCPYHNARMCMEIIERTLNGHGSGY